jgi:hypothetical protein
VASGSQCVSRIVARPYRTRNACGQCGGPDAVAIRRVALKVSLVLRSPLLWGGVAVAVTTAAFSLAPQGNTYRSNLARALDLSVPAPPVMAPPPGPPHGDTEAEEPLDGNNDLLLPLAPELPVIDAAATKDLENRASVLRFLMEVDPGILLLVAESGSGSCAMVDCMDVPALEVAALASGIRAMDQMRADEVATYWTRIATGLSLVLSTTALVLGPVRTAMTRARTTKPPSPRRTASRSIVRLARKRR